jgi:tetratricopeptide (TPR) repeat protein
VGREQELARLEMAFSACVEEPTPQVLLVTAPAGMGKSRVRHEFLRRIEERGHPVQVLLGRGDPMRTGSAYGLLGQALLGLCGLQGSEDLTVRREKLSRRTALHLPAPQAREVAEFLGELCGIPFPDEDSPGLRAARGDPQLMSPQLSRALVTFLKAECQQGAVLLVLEDLHWSDALTVRLVDEALYALAEQPLMVLALARPEVKESFPRLWAGRLQEQPLRGLSRKASARLVHEVLGPHVPEQVVDRIFEQSSGNALFLEELIRMVAEGRGGAPPETVLAMLQARLQRLEPGPRQVLLAASLFGRAFWVNGLEVLLGNQVSRRELERWLQQLTDLELLERQLGPRFPSQVEYRFRHTLVRDVAYGLVPEEDKTVGHQRVGRWLEQQNEPDPLVLAEHYQLGQQPERAALFFSRSAEQLFERSDMEGALRCVEAALMGGLTDEAHIRMRALQASIAFSMNDFGRTIEFGGGVLPELSPGSLPWSRLMAALLVANSFLGEQEQMFRLAGQLLCAPPEPDAVTAYVQALSFACNLFLMRGPRQAPQVIASRMAKVGAPHMDGNALLRGWVHFAHGCLAYQSGDSPWQTCDLAERCVQAFREVSLDVNGLLPGMMVLSGQSWAALGDMPRATKQLEEALAIARQSRQQLTITYVQAHQCLVLSGSADPGLLESLHASARELVAAKEENLLSKGAAYYMLARFAANRHALAEAEAHGREACTWLESLPYYQLQARVFLSSLLLAQHRVAEAREEALRGIHSLEKMGGGMHTLSVHLALAEACVAAGASAEADAALRTALDCLRLRARDIPEPAARERFLRQVPENALLLKRVQERWGQGVELLDAEPP